MLYGLRTKIANIVLEIGLHFIMTFVDSDTGITIILITGACAQSIAGDTKKIL